MASEPLPELPDHDAELRLLHEAILLRHRLPGVVIQARDGEVLEGRHTKAICDKHGISYHRTVITTPLTSEERQRIRLELNSIHRQMDRKQRQQLIKFATSLLPGWSSAMMEEELGISDKTITRWRDDSGSETPNLRLGRDGKKYPAVRSHGSRDHTEVDRSLQKLGANLPQRDDTTYKDVYISAKPTFPMVGNAPGIHSS
jgi:hypothetical protein